MRIPQTSDGYATLVLHDSLGVEAADSVKDYARGCVHFWLVDQIKIAAGIIMQTETCPVQDKGFDCGLFAAMSLSPLPKSRAILSRRSRAIESKCKIRDGQGKLGDDATALSEKAYCCPRNDKDADVKSNATNCVTLGLSWAKCMLVTKTKSEATRSL